MPHHFQPKQAATRLFALVLVVLLFCIAVLAAIYQGAQMSEGRRFTVRAALPGCWSHLDK
jgi:hypothetical protein